MVLELNDKNHFTVNSLPYAHEVYKHLGFEDTDSEQCIKGLKFFLMKKIINFQFIKLEDKYGDN